MRNLSTRFIKKLQLKQGVNTLKHALSKLIVDYTKINTDYHLIICNSNRSRRSRAYLLEELFKKQDFVRILVHFDIADEVLQRRVKQSQRSTNIFRSASSFEEVLAGQQKVTINEGITSPSEDEADYLFTIKDSNEVKSIIQEIVRIANYCS